MKPTEEQRHFPRFETAAAKSGASGLSIYIPEMMDAPQTPLDFSSGGFLLSLSKPPATDRGPLSGTIWVNDISLAEFTAKVAWVKEHNGGSPSWTAGLSVKMGEENRDYFASLLTAFLVGEQPEPTDLRNR